MADPEPVGALFCGEPLAARVERAEAGLIVGGVEGALRRDPDGRYLARELAGGWATWGGAGSPLNKVVGLGFGGPVPEAELAGGASLRLDGRGVAHLCGAATLPAHRRRGVQTALLAHRLRDAAESGCDLAVVTTQPGSKSQQNVQRLGFHLLYARAVLVRGGESA